MILWLSSVVESSGHTYCNQRVHLCCFIDRLLFGRDLAFILDVIQGGILVRPAIIIIEKSVDDFLLCSLPLHRNQCTKALHEFIATPSYLLLFFVTAPFPTLGLFLKHSAAAFIVMKPKGRRGVAILEVEDNATVPFRKARRPDNHGMDILETPGH